MNGKEIAELSAGILDRKKGSDIVIIDIMAKSAFADYFVIASAGSERQMGALCDEVESGLSKAGLTVKGVEGKPSSGWILIDCGDVIVNLFTAETRERYNIEKVWGDCEIIGLGDEDA